MDVPRVDRFGLLVAEGRSTRTDRQSAQPSITKMMYCACAVMHVLPRDALDWLGTVKLVLYAHCQTVISCSPLNVHKVICLYNTMLSVFVWDIWQPSDIMGRVRILLGLDGYG